ncbi:GNAT family N-acetyltransferase [Halobacillus massiliensis]|uniref:GNAT family N-acetyltransferase n=1 Tax=Halobacillus massiliensis TaxID=1926286 RepID=UPI00117BA653
MTEGNAGIGTALIKALIKLNSGWERIWLISTNDNMKALNFYQKIHQNALEKARAIKPDGTDGIFLRDEIELEICFT